MHPKCAECGAPVSLIPDGDPRYRGDPELQNELDKARADVRKLRHALRNNSNDSFLDDEAVEQALANTAHYENA